LPSPPFNPGVRDLVAGKRPWSDPLANDDIERGFLGWHENETNPTKAKLIASPSDWPFGSARYRDAYERLCLPAR
jgi:hypothetical protein